MTIQFNSHCMEKDVQIPFKYGNISRIIPLIQPDITDQKQAIAGNFKFFHTAFQIFGISFPLKNQRADHIPNLFPARPDCGIQLLLPDQKEGHSYC